MEPHGHDHLVLLSHHERAEPGCQSWSPVDGWCHWPGGGKPHPLHPSYYDVSRTSTAVIGVNLYPTCSKCQEWNSSPEEIWTYGWPQPWTAQKCQPYGYSALPWACFAPAGLSTHPVSSLGQPQSLPQMVWKSSDWTFTPIINYKRKLKFIKSANNHIHGQASSALQDISCSCAKQTCFLHQSQLPLGSLHFQRPLH